MEREDLISSPKFVNNFTRLKHSEEINGIVGDWIRERTRKEVEEAFERYEVAYSFVYDIADIFNDEQYRVREMLIRVLDEELGEAVVQNVVPKFSKTPGSVDFLGSKMGKHNEEIYCGELGYSKERLQQLRESGII